MLEYINSVSQPCANDSRNFNPDKIGYFVYRNIYGQEDKVTGILLGDNCYPRNFELAYGTHLVLCTDFKVRPIIAPFKFQAYRLDPKLEERLKICGKWYVNCHASFDRVSPKKEDFNSTRILYNPAKYEGSPNKAAYSWLEYVNGVARRTGWMAHCELSNPSNEALPFSVFDVPLKKFSASYTYLFNPGEFNVITPQIGSSPIAVATGTPGNMTIVNPAVCEVAKRLIPNVFNVQTLVQGTNMCPIHIDISLDSRPFGFAGRACALVMKIMFTLCKPGTFLDSRELLHDFLPITFSTYAFSPIALDAKNFRGDPIFATKAVRVMLGSDWSRTFQTALRQPMSQELRFKIMKCNSEANNLLVK